MTSITRQAPVLDLYQDIANITAAMLNAAQAADWAKVVCYGQEYCETVERLRALESSSQPLDETALGVKYNLLVRILDNDAAVRDLAMPQLAHLGHLLGRMKRQQSLLTAYRRGSNAAGL
jgi:flagellar protein FliT